MRRLHSAVLTLSIVALGGGAIVASSPADDGDLGSQKPEQVLASAQTAMAKVKSVHVAGTETAKGGVVTKLTGDLTAAGPARLTMASGKERVGLVILAKAAYIKGDADYWKSTGSDGKKLASKLADRWVKVPESAGAELAKSVGDLSPKHIATCLDSHLGTLTNKGMKTVGGRKVVVLQDAGDKPGAAPGQLLIAADGTSLPVREVQTGPKQAGGKTDKTCDSGGDDDTIKSDVTLSKYNKIGKITAPKGAISLESLSGGGGGTPV